MEILKVSQRIAYFQTLPSCLRCVEAPQFLLANQNQSLQLGDEPPSPCLLVQWHQGPTCPCGGLVFRCSRTRAIIPGGGILLLWTD